MTLINDNLYVMATSTDYNSTIYSKDIPIGLYTNPKDGSKPREAVAPMVLGSARDIVSITVNAEKDTLAELGDVPLKDRGIVRDENKNVQAISTWQKVFTHNKRAWLVYTLIRVPGKLSEKLFQSKQQVEDTFDERQLELFEEHYNVVRFTSPTIKMIEDEPNPELAQQKIIQRIRDEGEMSDFFLNSYTTHSLVQLTKYLVSLITNIETTTGTPGSH